MGIRLAYHACFKIFYYFGYCRDVSYTEEFLQLTSTQLKELLCRDSLVIQTEDAIFDSVMRWVRHDVMERKQYLSVYHMNN